MQPPPPTILPASDAHIDAIVAIERASGTGSVVALTHGHAVREAMQRGHDIIVALGGDSVAGWAWFSVGEARGADLHGQIYRVSVAAAQRRTGVASALIAHARTTLAVRGCTRVRVSLPAAAIDARAFFAAAGFAEDAVIVEAAL